MRKQSDTVYLTATDLAGHLNCRHLTALDLAVAEGTLEKPQHWDPLLEILRERGQQHEQAFIDHLRAQGLSLATIDGVEVSDEAATQTLQAMADGHDIIVQAALAHERWSGRADVLRKVEKPSRFGAWSYEVIDTKLARETKGGTVLQLCLYADLLDHVQGAAPDHVYVVAPWSDFAPLKFRYADYAAYFRQAKKAIEAATKTDQPAIYPDPTAHCDTCRWRERCETRRRADDHLCLVAGIAKTQITELQTHDINTTAALAAMPLPLSWKPGRGAPLSYEKAREQARIQIETRETGTLLYELLPISAESGLCKLPTPSPGDIFFDLEGDPFVGEQGLEYLFGWQYQDEDGTPVYDAIWAFDRAGEKHAFEQFMDFVAARREQYPDMHIYHYAAYEEGALKRLMGRYATREDALDNLLRGKVLVDLYSVVRNAIRAGVESYSIKKLEPLYGYERVTSLHDANIALARVQAGLELGDTPSISDEDRAAVESYNRDDCASTMALRGWLEEQRAALIAQGEKVPRPAPGQDGPSDDLTERQRAVAALIERLTADVPVDPEERNEDQQARWVLAYLLEWHRREDKATWWELFRLSGLTPDELVDERAGLAHLSLVDTVATTKTGIPTHRYSFSQQDTDLRGDEDLRSAGGDKIGKAVAVSTDDRTIDIKKSKATADIHPDAVFAHTHVPTTAQADALFRLGEYVADHGITGGGPYRAARALLLRESPPLGDQALREPGETALEAALRFAPHLGAGVLPIQGPPGTGKSYTGARMICALVRAGKKVGITANSHKVIRNLLDKVLQAADEMDVDLCCIQKPKAEDIEPDQDRLKFTKDNDGIFTALSSGRCHVAGATHFLWAREDAHDTLDVLVVDEAAQMSLANTLAVAQCAQTLILLGDPQQLDQPTQGTHPDGTGVSSLEHLLAGAHTIPADRGLFLERTFRLHPEICAFHSELFYDNKLFAQDGCEQQAIITDGPIPGHGLRYLPVVHTGNQSASIEEADAVARLVGAILESNTRWTDRAGNTKVLTLGDIVVITPYNAQVFEIQQRLPGARVGTVDKFQGQEAPIAIYSMATSSYADAPRGMEFLYSANRFNVAISRAQCLAILVASPAIFEPECKTPRQMQLANAFCRYLEKAHRIAAHSSPADDETLRPPGGQDQPR